MALTREERDSVSATISKGLNRAEETWGEVGHKFVRKTMVLDSAHAMESIEPSKIPGHPWVTDGTPKVDEFIAMVIDMRGSTKSLKTICSASHIKDGFQRIYYETSALLPAISVVTSFEGGVVTEYLGDGALVLFQVDENDRKESIKSASRAARNCVNEMRELINKQLDERYKFPNMSLGAGLAIGKALVTLVGSLDNLQPKAIGECIWEATKLSGGVNKVHVSDNIYDLWPAGKGGKMQFHRTSMREVSCYRLHQRE